MRKDHSHICDLSAHVSNLQHRIDNLPNSENTKTKEALLLSQIHGGSKMKFFPNMPKTIEIKSQITKEIFCKFETKFNYRVIETHE